LKAAEFEPLAADLYLDGIAVAIVARLLHCGSAGSDRRGHGTGLVKWRLKRVEDLIEADVSQPLLLSDLAACAGLSRMHFAAGFRTATGMRPHEYVVRKRIQRAQEILRTSAMPLAEVAFSVGFQTQAHFTTIFRRLLGETPGRWRQQQCLIFS
jgi:AraC family transcriptional regulator